MIVIAKRLETYVSLGNLGLSLGKVHCSNRKVLPPPPPKNLGPSPRKILFFLTKLYFSSWNFSYFMGSCLGLAYSLFLLREIISLKKLT
jgi:hypothetical protein